jgi:ADP-heptose:LPS heptosyltransferase
MKSSFYRDKWDSIAVSAGKDDLKRLSRQIAHSFLDYYLKDCRYEAAYIDLLCEMTTFSNDPELNNPGAHALFSIIIESLCDDFEALQTETYNRVMAQVISYCRTIPQGRDLDNRLRNFNLFSFDDLIDRTNSIRKDGSTLSPQKSIKKILLLSRITIGADVAITSIVLQRLSEIFPQAQIVLLGSGKLKEVYGGNPDISIRDIPYSRRGGLLERLSSWHCVLNIIAEETSTCSENEIVLIDTDSRLSQLGVLPLLPLDRYYFFDSRSDSSLNRRMSMAELTNAWINNLTGVESFSFSKVWIPQPYLDKAQGVCSKMRINGAKRIIAVNFGVGGNPRKRVGRHLEDKLLLTLLNEPDTLIVLDKGAGDEEVSYINSIINSIQSCGHNAHHTGFEFENMGKIKHGIVGVQSSIGQMAALIAHCDEFIGYDSACQHIAAALETPCLTVFAGSNNMRFIRRWSAHGPKECHIVHVDTLTDPSLIDVDDIITRIMHVRKMHAL